MNVKHILKEQIGKEELHGCVKSEMVARIISRFLSTVIWYMGRKCANIKCCSSGFPINFRRRKFEIRVIIFWSHVALINLLLFVSLIIAILTVCRCTSLQFWSLFL